RISLVSSRRTSTAGFRRKPPIFHANAETNHDPSSLGRWADERAALGRLRRGNAELRLDREFLKKRPRPSSSPSRTSLRADPAACAGGPGGNALGSVGPFR